MKLLFATCDEKPTGTDDDRLLADELTKRGHTVQSRSWTDQKVRWDEYDHVIIRSTWDYTPRLKDFLNWAEQVKAKTNLINSLEVIKWNCSKEYLSELEERQVSVIQSFFSSDLDACVGAIERLLPLHKKLVLKPAVSASAGLTYTITQAREALKYLPAILERGMATIQPFIFSIENDGEVSLIYFCHKNEFRFSHAVLKTPAQGDFRVQQNHGGSLSAFMPDRPLLTLAEQALKNLPGPTLYARVDIVDWKAQPKIGELELIEPELFFRCEAGSATRFAEALATI